MVNVTLEVGVKEGKTCLKNYARFRRTVSLQVIPCLGQEVHVNFDEKNIDLEVYDIFHDMENGNVNLILTYMGWSRSLKLGEDALISLGPNEDNEDEDFDWAASMKKIKENGWTEQESLCM